MRGDRNTDAGLAEIAQRYAGMLQPGAAAQGPARASLEAALSVQVGRLATAMETTNSRREQLNRNVYPFNLNPALITGSGTADSPMTLGPRDGYAWDVRRLTAASFSAGSVAVYQDGVSDMGALFTFTQAGTWWIPSAALILRGSERLILVGTGIAGNVTISGRAIMIREDFLGEYLI